VVQVAVLYGQFIDYVSPYDDSGVAVEVGIGGCEVAEALVVVVVVIVIDEGADLAFEISGQVINFSKTRFSGSGASARSFARFGDDKALPKLIITVSSPLTPYHFGVEVPDWWTDVI